MNDLFNRSGRNAERIKEVLAYNVKDFGAKGDGVADDRPAINSAIGFVNSIGGGTVFFPDGTYMLSKDPSSPKQAISLLSNVSLKGWSREGTIFKLLDSVASDTPVMSGDVGGVISNVSLTDFTVDGNKGRFNPIPTADENEGINFKNGEDISITNVRATNCGMDGVDLDGGTKIALTNLLLDDNGGCGIHAAGSGVVYLTISDCQLYNNGGVRVNASGDGALSAGNLDLLVSDYVTVNNCISVGGPRPLSVFGSRRVHVSNSIFIGSTAKPAVGLRGKPFTNKGNAKFANCCIIGATDNLAQGVLLSDAFQSAEFSQCYIRGRDGIKVEDGGRLSVKGCEIDPTNHGIYVQNTNGYDVYVGGDTVFTESIFGNDIRVEDNCRGVVDGITMKKSGGTGIKLGSEVDTPWKIKNVTCETSREVVQIDSGSAGGHIIEDIYAPSGSVEIIGSPNNVVRSSELNALKFNFTGATLKSCTVLFWNQGKANTFKLYPIHQSCTVLFWNQGKARYR